MSATNGNGSNEGPKTIAVPATVAGEVMRTGFGTNEIERSAETASTAMASQARAAVEARYIVAMQRPRDLMVVRARILKDCARPAFADAAIYHKPIGDGIEGPSIRLAEAAARAMTNIDTSVYVLYDDPKKRIIRVSTTDLESNITFTKDVTVPKTMERSNVKQGQTILGSRFNSKGRPVFLVAAETDDDILNTENALASKAMRVCLLRLIPGDILDEALREAFNTIEKKIKEDPDEAIKKMCDRFEMELGVLPEQLKEYLGHPIAQTTVAEVALMRKLFAALTEGETTWTEVMENRGAKGEASQAPGAPTTVTPAAGKPSVDDLAAQAKARREASAKPAAQPAGTQTSIATAGAAKPKPSEDNEDPDADDKANAAPGPNEGPPAPPKRGFTPPSPAGDMPAWAGAGKKPRGDDGSGIK